MTSVAGVSCWLYHEIESGNLLIGADPSYRHYLSEIFSAVLDDLSATRKTTGGAS
jgi:sarcosine oxidase subunit gamma